MRSVRPPGRGSRGLSASLLLCCALLAPSPSPAQLRIASLPADLTELSLDDLLKVEITTVSRHAEPLNHAAAAVFVLSGEEIMRSGARSIPEALRLVPGLQVARSNANTYKISARGFDGSGDKLQVLVDGRSVYTPLTSSVFWDVLDTFLPDIDRIEVIRGPGATLWGANAVNGVINIITTPPAQTHGQMLVAGGGTEERAFAALRSGTAVGSAGDVRFYVNAFDRDDAQLDSGKQAEDGQRQYTAGARSDWQLAEHHQISLAGDLYSAREHALGPVSMQPRNNRLSGGNLNAHWNWEPGARSAVLTSLSYDHYRRVVPETFEESRDTWDLGVQHDLWLGERHNLTYGAGYRNSRDRTGGPPLAVIFDPASRSLATYSAFAQDQVHFADDRVVWTLGSKVERNSFSGFELEPGTRVGWQASPAWFTWAAVSRAVRTPNRVDQDIAIYCPPPDGIAGFCGADTRFRIGNPDFDSEKLIAYEWGLRYSGHRAWSADLATFYDDYTDLRSAEGSGLDLTFANHLRGHGSGAELSFNWRPGARVDVRSFYAYLDLSVRPDAGSRDASSAPNTQGSSARHTAGLMASWQASADWSAAGVLRYAGARHRTATPNAASGDVSVPAYTELALRLAWRPWRPLELALAGRNLLHASHPEFGAQNTRSELERSGTLEVIWEWP